MVIVIMLVTVTVPHFSTLVMHAELSNSDTLEVGLYNIYKYITSTYTWLANFLAEPLANLFTNSLTITKIAAD